MIGIDDWIDVKGPKKKKLSKKERQEQLRLAQEEAQRAEEGDMSRNLFGARGWA